MIRENMGYWANGKGHVHRQIAEDILGKPLPKGACVHHIDFDKKNNSHKNLIICPSKDYHALLHRRQNAVNAGFPAHYRKCQTCKQYDDPDNLYIQDRGKKGWRIRHRYCHAATEAARMHGGLK